MVIGFLGTGAIAEAVIIGLLESANFPGQIYVSKRSDERSARLANRFSSVTVCDENQSIVDQAEIIFVATLPEHALEVIRKLDFRDGQMVVSLAAGISVEQLKAEIKPANEVYRVIPMPPNEFGVGPIPVYPPSVQLRQLLGGIGTIIPVENESQFSTFSASSAMMATFFELVAANARWIEARGVSAEHSAAYSTSLFQSLATMTTRVSESELQELSDDCLTAGGLNEQVLFANRNEGWFDFQMSELDKILKRITG